MLYQLRDGWGCWVESLFDKVFSIKTTRSHASSVEINQCGHVVHLQVSAPSIEITVEQAQCTQDIRLVSLV